MTEAYESALSRMEDRLRLLSELTREFACSTGDYRALLELVARRLGETIGETCLIRMVPPDGIHFDTCEGLYHPDPVFAEEWRELVHTTPQRIDEGITGRVLTSGKAILVASTSSVQLATETPRHRDTIARLAITSVMGAPLRAEGTPIGVVVMTRSDRDRPYTTHDLRLLEDLASHASIAITNSRLMAADATRREIEEQSRRVHETSRLKSEFLANMSHELRTPLNAVIGFSSLIHDGKAGPVSETTREYLGEVLASSRHLLAMIDDILDLARVESGRMELALEPVDLASLVSSAHHTVHALAAERRIEIRVDLCPAVQTVNVDPRIVTQVLYNYLSNAIKFSPDGAVVTVRTAEAGADWFRLEIEDAGIGIKPEDMSRLFVEFQQLEAGTAKKYAGTGLGLAVTRRIVELHGGTVEARSEYGVGSTFGAVLPRGTPLVAAPG